MKVRAQQGDTVDALCWRHLGTTRDVVEATYGLNPGLADLGAVLPHGHVVVLPDAAPQPTAAPAVKLWD
ncbi:phage tail protein [Achromobacter xylosoxidans]|jgi:phage tail protein X|uniref:tail protein X n=1 Tax=Alcaligenes xylosoxydans xylosoxydans TaxID=85698 RepID=UPI000735CEF5|nr:tail protein X [Achromobacter xylosoxidans]PNM89940.1 phage tail protein [Achromobacter xylosoxidans]